MATILRPSTALPSRILHRSTRHLLRSPQRRTFLPNPFGSQEPLLVAASKTLPYPKSAIYDIISDVTQYSSFLPYCVSSTVTKWSNPDSITGRRWPEEATLVVGWKDITESFKSRVYCVPGRIVESVSGQSKTSLPKEDIKHHSELVGTVGSSGSLMTHLVSRWTVSDAQNKPGHTHVDLAVEFQFANPIYSALSSAASPKMADIMMRAFEDRVKAAMAQPPRT